jgi:Tol biopolymer transport system component/predicted Ser/Thr protein kinase
MTPERWARITELLGAALEKPDGAERNAWLDKVCADDKPLRRDLDRLLAAQAGSSMVSPVPEVLEGDALELGAGDTFGQYRVESKIGQGGMGAVYLAFDTHLQRKVALKVLPPEHALDRDGKQRLIREARAASALNHPNIVTIYEAGSDHDVDFIAMEYVEGRGLDELIGPKGMPVAQLLRYAIQGADAMARAHEAKILHRDIKPANIRVTSQDRVKVLDFGLAKLMASTAAAGAGSASLTGQGLIAGTAAYMSPEQAEGRVLDARSDIFSFGSVLYEMASGQRPFKADSRLTTMYKVVNEEPQRIAGIPPQLESLILRCLRKEPSRRVQTMDDLRAALEDLEIGLGPQAGGLRARQALRLALGIAALLIVIVVAMRLSRRVPEGTFGQTVKFTITPNRLGRGGDNEVDAEVSISADGKRISYVEAQGGQLWVRDLDKEDARIVPGATHVYQAFWSPDSRQIGYSAGLQQIMLIPAEGGTPAPLVKLPGLFKRASWSSDGKTIVYGDPTGLYTIPAAGGTPTLVFQHSHVEHPSFLELPDGRRAYLFQAVEARQNGHGIYVQVAGEQQRRLITMTKSNNPYPAYSSSGHIVYTDGVLEDSSIWALPFSLSKLAATGKAFQVAARGSSPQVSRNGTLVYSDVPSSQLQLAWWDRTGKRISPIGDPRHPDWVALSPNGRKLAMEVDHDIWIYDLERGGKTQVTSDAAVEIHGGWSPSGDAIVYASNRAGNFDLFTQSATGDGTPQMLVGTPMQERFPAWSPDLKFLMYNMAPEGRPGDIVYRTRQADGTLGDPKVFIQTPPHVEGDAHFSNDGRFVAYMSNESGKFEIYVRDFPNGTKKWPVSVGGGMMARWGAGGKEILYLEGRRLMAVPVSLHPEFAAGKPEFLFEIPSTVNFWDVTADGKRFVIWERLPNPAPLSVHVSHNWFEEFRNRLARD